MGSHFSKNKKSTKKSTKKLVRRNNEDRKNATFEVVNFHPGVFSTRNVLTEACENCKNSNPNYENLVHLQHQLAVEKERYSELLFEYTLQHFMKRVQQQFKTQNKCISGGKFDDYADLLNGGVAHSERDDLEHICLYLAELSRLEELVQVSFALQTDGIIGRKTITSWFGKDQKLFKMQVSITVVSLVTQDTDV